ncbi:hypothetical protein AgCh_008876 [Apium graveolens]
MPTYLCELENQAKKRSSDLWGEAPYIDGESLNWTWFTSQCISMIARDLPFIETNRTTARIFPAVLDVENPEFKRKLDRMVEINTKLVAIGETDDIAFVKNLKRIPLIAALASELLAAYLMKPVDSGSVDLAEFETQLV